MYVRTFKYLNMISIQICGGLGNQIFQIFAALAYSIKYKVSLILPMRGGGGARPTYWNNFLQALGPIVTDKHIPFRKLNEAGFEYVDIPLINYDFKLVGYFQSYKYFQEHKEVIYKYIKLDDSIDKLKDEYNYSNIVSLHFRVGDYIEIQQHHPLMSIGYYVSALKTLVSQTNRDDWTILFFCEETDMHYVEPKIAILHSQFPNLVFEKIHNKYSDWQQMLIMSLCQHNIIANSTFSWWGAYFNKNLDKKVYYPSLWFGPAKGENNMDDLFPPEWNKIMC